MTLACACRLAESLHKLAYLNQAWPSHPGAEAREPQKTFVGRPLDVCEVLEPAANLSIEVRIGSGSRAGASLFAAGQFAHGP